MHFLAIDLGTTSLKGAILDLEHQQLRHVTRVAMPDKLPNPEPLMHELDPQMVLDLMRQFIADLRTHAPNAQGLVMCAQMHGMLLLGPDHTPRTPIITWQDQRTRLPHPSGQGSCLEWAQDRLTQEHRQQLGNEARPGIPNVTLPWFDVDSVQDSLVASLPDYLLSQLSGNPPVIDQSLAAAYGLLDLRNSQWHDAVIDSLGLTHLRFPQQHDALPYRGGDNDRVGLVGSACISDKKRAANTEKPQKRLA